jgi:hypothetical protein
VAFWGRLLEAVLVGFVVGFVAWFLLGWGGAEMGIGDVVVIGVDFVDDVVDGDVENPSVWVLIEMGSAWLHWVSICTQHHRC